MKRHYLGLSAGAGASKLLGLLREVFLARSFGTGPVTDAYRASLSLTLAPIQILATHVIQTCFIPLHRRYTATDPRRAAALFQTLLLFFSVGGLGMAALLFLLAQPIIAALLPGFDPARQATTTAMLRIMALGLPAYIVTALLGSLGMAHKDFWIPSVRPGMQNVGLLAAILVAVAVGRPTVIALGFTATYWLLAGVAALHMRARGMFPRTWCLDGALLKPMVEAIWVPLRPLVLLAGVAQAGLLVERHLSSLVGGGTVAAMDYARFVSETAHTLLLVPLGLVSLSHFATLDPEPLRRRVDQILALLLLVLLPASAFLALNRREVVALLYMRGAFDLESLRATSTALLGLSCGLWAAGASFFLRSVLHARLRNDRVLRAECAAIVLQVGFILLLYRPLGILALGLGPSLAALVSFFYYVRWTDGALSLTRRVGRVMAFALAPYLVAAMLLKQYVGGIWLPLLLTVGYWIAWTLASPTLRRALAGRTAARADASEGNGRSGEERS